ncbi:NACHT domain-containing protein [Streptomyces sp. NPDC057302]|uniref:NACHT domain-containing protein n=1 Tax=Streptomyces sp. NPDC057302 TaxID=3346094 RepID=UPI0036364A8E
MSYADAVRLLGGSESPALAALDRLTGGALLVATGGGSALALSLFDARGELARLSQSLVAGLAERSRGLGRFDRTQRLAAAHAVVVLASYFDTLKDLDLPFDRRELNFGRTEAVLLATGRSPESGRLAALADELLRAEVPMPAPHRPYEWELVALTGFYRRLSEQLLEYVSGCAAWEAVPEPEREEVRAGLVDSAPQQAVSAYEIMYRRLAAECPEVAVWVNVIDHQATRYEVRRLEGTLRQLEEAVARAADGRVAAERYMSLNRASRAAMDAPLLSLEDLPEGLTVPTLGEGYVSPDFKVAAFGAADRLSEEHWWEERHVHHDLEGFLADLFTAPQAVESPLLLLGQPGSGKSVLTRVLAARLPADEFLVVRVPLSAVPADAAIQDQIETAIRDATGETMDWPDVTRTARRALPVVLLDGFDELLQATGVSQSDYVQKVAAFQQREATHGRPLAVVVTSRTAVADRARLSPGGVAVRLEPFSDAQVTKWLELWNGTNAAHFRHQSLLPLSPEHVLPQRELGGQPLLLLMLALYDAEGNAFQRDQGELASFDLYERLLARFAAREVRKNDPGLSNEQLAHAVEAELLCLSVTAFAMVNRNKQWITEEELTADLEVLLPQRTHAARPTDLRAALTPGQVVVGRFFFIHRAEASRDGVRLRSFEFLHSTFSEFLVARLTLRELEDLTRAARADASRVRVPAPDDAFLHALLSFETLSVRSATLIFLHQALGRLPTEQLTALRPLLLRLFHFALHARHERVFDGYRPGNLPVPARHASWAANLLLLLVLLGEPVRGRELFPEEEPAHHWSRLMTLLKSQLMDEGWRTFSMAICLERTWSEQRDEQFKDIYLSLAPIYSEMRPPAPAVDPYWTYGIAPGSEERGRMSWLRHGHEPMRRETYLLCDRDRDVLQHDLEPLCDAGLGTAISNFTGYWDDRCVSAAHALLQLWAARGQGPAPAEPSSPHRTAITVALHSLPGALPEFQDFIERYLRTVVHEWHATGRHPGEAWLDGVMAIVRTNHPGQTAGRELDRHARTLFDDTD